MAKKDVPALISAAGYLTSVYTALVKAVEKLGGKAEDVYVLATPGGEKLVEQIAELIVGFSQKIWRIFTIGGREPDDLAENLKHRGFRVSGWACDLMGRMNISSAGQIKVEKFQLSEWFDHDPTVVEIRAKVKELGYMELPQDAGPAIRADYFDQPLNEWATAISEPIAGSVGHLCWFCLERRDGGLWLNGNAADPGRQFNRLNFVLVGVPPTF